MTLSATATTTLEAENYDLGGQGVAYSDKDTFNYGQSYRTGEGVDVYAYNGCSNGHGVGWTSSLEWVGYTIDVAAAGHYDITARASSGSSGGSFHLEFGPVGQIGGGAGSGVASTSSFTIFGTGDWDTYQPVTLHDVPLSAGQQWMRLVEESGGYNFDKLDFTRVAPAAPTGLSATAGDGQVSLTWDADADADSYNVYRGTSSNGEGATPLATGITTAGYIDSTATNRTAYYYKVSAVNGGGEGDLSAEASATPQESVPEVPEGLAAAGYGQVTLNWTAVTGASGYNIYRGTSSGAEALLEGAITTTEYVDSAVTNGTDYYYKISAVNGAGESGLSIEMQATPQVPPPLAISGIDIVDEGAAYVLNIARTGGAVGTSSLLIDWGDGTTDTVAGTATTASHFFHDGPYLYPIQASTEVDGTAYDSNVLNVLVDTAAPQLTLAGDASVAAGSSYTLDLSAVYPAEDADGDAIASWLIDWGDGSEPQQVVGGSAIVTHTFAGGVASSTIFAQGIDEDGTYYAVPMEVTITGVTAPAAPTALTAIPFSATRIDLSWTDIAADATGFTVNRSADGGQTWQDIATVGRDQTLYTDTGLDPATSYSYAVVANNDAGSSAASGSSAATTPTATPTLTPTINLDGTVTLDWDLAGIGVSEYELEMKQEGIDENFSLIATPASTDEDYTTSLVPGTSYFFRLRADFSDGTVTDYAQTPVYAPLPDTTQPDPNAPPAPVDLGGLDLWETPGHYYHLHFDGPYDSGSYHTNIDLRRRDDPYEVIAGGGAYVQGVMSSGPGRPDDDGYVSTDGADYWASLFADSPGAPYIVRISITDNTTNLTSAWSQPFEFTRDGTAVPPLTLSATAAEDDQVQLSWTGDDATDHAVAIYAVKDGQVIWDSTDHMELLASEGGALVPAQATGSQFFAVVSDYFIIPNSGRSAYSNFVDGQGLPQPPAAPDGLTAVGDRNKPNQINVRWRNIPNNETGFIVERSVNGGAFTQIGTTAKDVTAYNDVPSAATVSYPYDVKYRVKSTNAAGNSTPSVVCKAILEYGGPDVTARLISMAANIGQQYDSLSFIQKRRLVWGTIWPGSAMYYWDMTNFPQRQFGDDGDAAGVGRGAGTVTVGGKVYDQQAVNYWLGGLLTYELNKTFPIDAHALKSLAFLHIYRQNDVNDEKWAWYNAGIAVDPSLPTPPANLKDMLPGVRGSEKVEWTWGFLTGRE